MKTVKKLGIWMDHSIAYLIEFSANPSEIITIKSKFSHQEKMEALSKSESLMHNKENQQLSIYYRKLAKLIKDFSQVVLFGPSDAKSELFDILIKKEQFENIKIEIKNTDKMTDKQKKSFVEAYFSKQ